MQCMSGMIIAMGYSTMDPLIVCFHSRRRHRDGRRRIFLRPVTYVRMYLRTPRGAEHDGDTTSRSVSLYILINRISTLARSGIYHLRIGRKLTEAILHLSLLLPLVHPISPLDHLKQRLAILALSSNLRFRRKSSWTCNPRIYSSDKIYYFHIRTYLPSYR